MYSIALVDDELQWRETIAHQIRQSLKLLQIEEYTKANFDNPSSLLSEISRGTIYDVVFTDIFLGRLNGIELAKQIRQASPKTRVILFSSSTDYVYEGYDVSAVYYFVKPVNPDKLTSVIGRDYYTYHVRQTILIQDTGGGRSVVPLRKIIYCEHYYGQTRVVTEDGVIETTMKLSELMERLPHTSFVLSQKSFIVNMLHVKNLARYTFTLKNGEDVPVSKLGYLDVRDQYEHFLVAQAQL